MINTDLSIQHRWIGRRGFNNTFSVTFTDSGAFDISAYTFILNIRRIGGTANLIQLTQSTGLTNGGATGILNVQLTATQTSSIDADSYYYELIYTVGSLSYGLLHGTFDNLSQYNQENENNSISVYVNLVGTDVNLSITLAGGGAASLYQVYTALLTQSGENAPVATVLENTLGNIVWTRDAEGEYRAELEGAFTINKTVIFCCANTGQGNSVIFDADDDETTIHLSTSDFENNLFDSLLDNTPIEIRVYN